MNNYFYLVPRLILDSDQSHRITTIPDFPSTPCGFVKYFFLKCVLGSHHDQKTFTIGLLEYFYIVDVVSCARLLPVFIILCAVISPESVAVLVLQETGLSTLKVPGESALRLGRVTKP